MKIRLSFQSQLILAALVAVIVGFLLDGSIAAYTSPGAPSVPTQSTLMPQLPNPDHQNTPTPIAATSRPPDIQTPHPFVDLPLAWMMEVKVFRQAPPQIIGLTRLSEGRITELRDGNGSLKILDQQHNVLYENKFLVVFTNGEPPKIVDQLTLILVMPAIENAYSVEIITPQGETSYDFPNH
jgi:hypothetical protein